MSVFVLDQRKRPLMPCSERRARLLLSRKRAVVHRLWPFTIRLKDRSREASQLQPVALKLDPGSKITGIALVRVEETRQGEVHHALHLAEMSHRGQVVHQAMRRRAAYRRRRRSANLRHRPPRFAHRSRPRAGCRPRCAHASATCSPGHVAMLAGYPWVGSRSSGSSSTRPCSGIRRSAVFSIKGERCVAGKSAATCWRNSDGAACTVGVARPPLRSITLCPGVVAAPTESATSCSVAMTAIAPKATGPQSSSDTHTCRRRLSSPCGTLLQSTPRVLP